ncbi:hypothetical protein [Aeoliella mucimassa]|uniref:Lipoprotein n=1 Tax=Aeoliella mucimassa TaxID=2527972 RepID=A0A518AM79_9BACT|nr:hypothetical protein [Aeoliella mucimassa]QDU55821.1 hypothetical protein Pan181_20180 [Aeoliella mucimassa]
MKRVERILTPIKMVLMLVVLVVAMVGCGGGSDKDNQVPDNPAPLPDPSDRY